MKPIKVQPNHPFKIFVKGLNWVGDAIIATPTLAQLRRTHPDAEITLMVRPWVAAVYEHNPDINQLWVHDDSASLGAFMKAVEMVRGGKFTIGLALPNSFRSAALLYFGNIPHRIGYKHGGRGFMLNRAVDIDPDVLTEHQIFYYLGLIQEMCGKPPQPLRLTLNPGELEREEISRLLAQNGLDRGRPLVGIAPGSINSEAKRWPADRFAAVADRIAQEAKSEILLIGSAKESDVLTRVASLCKEPVHNLGGKVSLSQVIALIERLDGIICNDSGAMHLAAALCIPTVAIFGPTEWATTYPFSNVATIVRKEGVKCAPCMLRECPTDHICMDDVTTEMVFAAFKKVIKQSRDPRIKTINQQRQGTQTGD